MKLETRRDLSLIVADVLGHILRSPLDSDGVGHLAANAGYSRFHFSRVFQDFCHETPGSLHRRIKLERAAFNLLQGSLVHDAASFAGFESCEAFCRAFKRAFGATPREFRRGGRDWKLDSPEDLHWNPHWEAGSYDPALTLKYETRFSRMSPRTAAVIRHVGNYARLWEGWSKVPQIPDRQWLTLYRDTLWTCPQSDLMRSDLGFYLDGHPLPSGFHAVEIPGGLTLKTDRFVARTDRNEAWSFLSGSWPNSKCGWDEYEDWPLPFEKVRTRICITVGS